MRTLASRAAIQLNDTHPSLAVPELIRLLIDKYNLDLARGARDQPADDFLHEPHPAARSAGNPGRSSCSSACCRATSRSSTGSTSRISRLRPSARPADTRLYRVGFADRRGRRPPRAHGAPRLRRLAPHQRRLGNAFRTDEADGVCRSQHALSRPHHQQDQRRHLPPLAASLQSRPDRALERRLRRSRARRPARRARGWSGFPRTAR